MNGKWSVFSLVLVVAVVFTGIAMGAKGRSSSGERPAVTRELPSDWVWQKKTVTFDDMYRR